MKISLVMENKPIRHHAHRLRRLLTLLSACLLLSCSEDRLDEYDASRTALNIAKGTIFGSAAHYPEEYTFNAYFLGGDIHDYELRIPVRLQGLIDNNRDRTYKVAIDRNVSPTPAEGLYTLAEKQDARDQDRKSTLLNSSHANISYAVFCLKKKKQLNAQHHPGDLVELQDDRGCYRGPYSTELTCTSHGLSRAHQSANSTRFGQLG